MLAIEQAGDHAAKHAIAKEFQPLVTGAGLAGGAAVGERANEQRPNGKFMDQDRSLIPY